MELINCLNIFLIAFVLLFFVVSLIVDFKRDYTSEDIVSTLKERNGKEYIYIETFIWQFNKKKKIREIFKQNSRYSVKGFDYTIISCIKDQKTDWIIHSFEFGVKPVEESKPADIKYFIYINGRDNQTVNFKNTINYNEVCSEIYKSNIDNNDKELLLKFFNSLSNDVAFDKENTNTFLELLRKYEPVFSFANNIIGIISAALSM